VTGAGDTVSAALGCGIAAGLALRDATALANLAAGVVVGKLGTATASLDEIREAMTPTPAAHGLLDVVLAACQRAAPPASASRCCWGPRPARRGPAGPPRQAGQAAERLLVIEPAATDATAPRCWPPCARWTGWSRPTRYLRHAAAAVRPDALLCGPPAPACRPGSSPRCCRMNR
jgi:D-beta-D-heptose 7-phosphate kinase/D-beta-D-heptose 1-phosphate adenosyltransferase